MTQHPLSAPERSNLLRAVPFELRDSDASGNTDGLTLDGYAAVFGEPTMIDSWEGTFSETIQRGAFKKSLSERTPVMQFDHGTHPMVGSIPIGNIDTLSEDPHGLHVTARLADNWLTQPVRDAIGNGSIDGMSFRFQVVRDKWQTADGTALTDPMQIMEYLYSPPDGQPLVRTLLEVKCPELGPVVFPAYEQTSVGVRSQVTLDLGRLNEPDQRRELARAVFAADAAPDSTMQVAAVHASSTTDTPQPTDDTSAGEHESSSTEPSRLRTHLRDFTSQWRVVVENDSRRRSA